MHRRLLLGLFAALSGLMLALALDGFEPVVPGTLLVASDRLGDPNFSETVVFLIRRTSDEGTMGIVLNRPMDLTLAKAFPQMHATTDPVYEGGPVSSDAVQALLRTADKPENAEHIVGDVYVVSRKALLEKSITDHLPKDKFRVYLGYAGWGPGQLENEIRQGAWSTLHANKYVFDGEPASLWQRLKRDSQSQVAQVTDTTVARNVTMKGCTCFAPQFWRY